MSHFTDVIVITPPKNVTTRTSQFFHFEPLPIKNYGYARALDRMELSMWNNESIIT